MSESSIQARCRSAMKTLSARGVFTEIDVVNEASKGRDWSSKQFKEAANRAYIVLQTAYRQGVLVRYGPVDFMGNQDYARRGTKIVYGHSQQGPSVWETPNGEFPRILAKGDGLSAPGRKPKQIINRDDARSWTEQKPTKAKERDLRPVGMSGPPVDTRPFEKRIQSLEAEIRRYEAEAGNGSNGLRKEDKEDIADLVWERFKTAFVA